MCMRHNLIELQREIDECSIIAEDFKTCIGNGQTEQADYQKGHS